MPLTFYMDTHCYSSGRIEGLSKLQEPGDGLPVSGVYPLHDTWEEDSDDDDDEDMKKIKDEKPWKDDWMVFRDGAWKDAAEFNKKTRRPIVSSSNLVTGEIIKANHFLCAHSESAPQSFHSAHCSKQPFPSPEFLLLVLENSCSSCSTHDSSSSVL